MVGTLTGLGVSLGGVSDDPEGRLVSCDLNLIDVIRVSLAEKSVTFVLKHVNKSLNGTSGLMFVETELEVHAHDRELVTLVRKNDFKG
jgi:hypothetical protein